MTMSLAASAASRSSQGAASAPPIASAVRAAWAIVRLTIVTCCTPCDFMCMAVSLPISPAPTTTTLRPFRSPKIFCASEAAAKLTDTAPDPERRLGPDPLADAERRVEQPVQDRADRTDVRGGGVRLFHLAEDLRLADDEGVEPGGDPEQVSRRVEVGELVDVRRQRGSIDAVELGDEPYQLGACAVALIACGIQLGAVTGRQDDGLAARQPRCQLAQRHVEPARVEVDPLAQLHRRRPMTDSDQEEVHQLSRAAKSHGFSSGNS